MPLWRAPPTCCCLLLPAAACTLHTCCATPAAATPCHLPPPCLPVPCTFYTFATCMPCHACHTCSFTTTTFALPCFATAILHTPHLCTTCTTARHLPPFYFACGLGSVISRGSFLVQCRFILSTPFGYVNDAAPGWIGSIIGGMGFPVG